MFKSGEVTLTGGAGSFSKMGVTVMPAVAQEIVSAPANFYFNVHSTMNPAASRAASSWRPSNAHGL